MEFPKRGRAFLQGSLRRSPKATIPGAATGADENASSKHLVPVGAASPKRKKVLGERNDSGVGGMEGAASAPVQQPKLALSPPTPASRGAGPYDPKTNYTTPRPAFLRYDPERRREILLRVSRAAENSLCESGRNFGSMNMDEFMANIWNVEEFQAATAG
ncbi:hypothetical protein ZEAMMB73_Zm00001d053385 [Zea mays]|uniref:Uncharacterized protein n=1 Tax=Zea mays TaxID=4577 RepID=A0A1D6QP63_MAIZE|nr:hypothetical protein ZEAMMB73_Zm00001d053385 [Zea mays]